MASPPPELPPVNDPAHMLLIVVGAHLRAEVADRPLAYRLARRISTWLARSAPELNVPLTPVVCCDIWYINQPALHSRPTISLGGPGVNALSAYYAGKLTTALIQDDQLLIQLDIEFVDLRACVWGRDHRLTVQALKLFVRKYLDGYLRAAATQVEPQE